MFGKIIDIYDNYVIIENATHKLEVNYVNFHVVFPENDRSVVGEIVGMNENEIKVFLVGEIKNDRFSSGVLRKPNFNSKPRIVYKSEVEKFLGSQDIGSSDTLYVGKSLTYDGFNVCANLNDFFSNHFAILGNTGSGKSCGVSRILQNLFYHNDDKMPVNAHLVLFDVYGEYNSALSKINELPGMGYKYFTSDLKFGDGDVINIPAYFLEVDDLALLLNATSPTQLPILEKALQLVYIFKSEDQSMQLYKDNIIAKALLDVLSSVRSSTQIRDQIVAVLSRYNTPRINLNSQIVQPGYTRTLTQCLNIDNQGKMNNVQLVVDYLEKIQKFDISSVVIDRSVIYDLDDLYYALDFALISEGMLKSEKVYDEYNQLLTRLLQIINSDNKKFFDPGTHKISKDTFVKNLFDGYQIINMNLNYIDERFAKTLTKIFTKIFFNFSTSLKERGSYPIHVILEEAHRYVQNDNDINVIGYNIFDRITKEGRKYGVLLGLITQRPSELSETSISQCSNFLVLRTLHPKDLTYIKEMVPNVSEEVLSILKTLQPGCSIAFGSAFKVPISLKMDLPMPEPYSSNSDVARIWYALN